MLGARRLRHRGSGIRSLGGNIGFRRRVLCRLSLDVGLVVSLLDQRGGLVFL